MRCRFDVVGRDPLAGRVSLLVMAAADLVGGLGDKADLLHGRRVGTWVLTSVSKSGAIGGWFYVTA